MKVEVINTGTELLLGTVVNTHLGFLARRLLPLGLTIQKQVTVADDRPLLREAFAAALGRAELVLVTGGLGPTAADLTREVVAELLGRKLELDPQILERIAARFRARNLPMPDRVRVQAMVPAGARVLPNRHGTAPGLALEQQGRWIVLLPGPPRELQPMFDEFVLPWIRENFPLPTVECRTFRTVGIGESLLEEIVGSQLAALPGCEVGYCARPGEVDVRLLVRGASRTEARAIADRGEEIVRQNLGEWIFGTDDERLEAVLVRELTRRGETLAVAESCTGGYLAHRITNVPGSSVVFVNGCVTYSNESKVRLLGVPPSLMEAQGAVSEAVARAMAEGIRAASRTTYGIGITGIAGPGGGSPAKPVGLVHMALAGPGGTTAVEQRFSFDRETFKFVATQFALDLLRRCVAKSDRR